MQVAGVCNTLACNHLLQGGCVVPGGLWLLGGPLWALPFARYVCLCCVL